MSTSTTERLDELESRYATLDALCRHLLDELARVRAETPQCEAFLRRAFNAAWLGGPAHFADFSRNMIYFTSRDLPLPTLEEIDDEHFDGLAGDD